MMMMTDTKMLLTTVGDNNVMHDDVECLTPPYSSVNSSTGSPCSTVTDSQGPQSPLFQDDLSPVAIEGPSAVYSVRVPTHLVNIENSWKFVNLENSWNFGCDKSIYAGFDTLMAVSRKVNLCYKGMNGKQQ